MSEIVKWWIKSTNAVERSILIRFAGNLQSKKIDTIKQCFPKVDNCLIILTVLNIIAVFNVLQGITKVIMLEELNLDI